MNGSDRAQASRNGFTMVEVIVSIVLMVMIMAGAYRIIIQASKLSRTARDEYIAMTLCKNRLERARNFDYEDLHLLSESQLVVNDNGAPNSQGGFARTTVVSTNVPAALQTTVKVTVQVRNRKTGTFGAFARSDETIFTEYIAPPVP